MRLPPTNHGDGDNGFMATLVAIARDKGVSAYIGDGSNRWPAVHRLDSAHLFRLAVEKAPAGSTLHAVADEGVPIRDIAEVIGRHLDVPVVSIPAEQAAAHFTWLGGFIGMDSPASSALTRELMGGSRRSPGSSRTSTRATTSSSPPPDPEDGLTRRTRRTSRRPVQIAAICTGPEVLGCHGSSARVRRAEHDQQREVFGDVGEVVLLARRHEDHRTGAHLGRVVRRHDPGLARGDHVDLVLGVRALVVRPARRYAVGPHGQGRHREVLDPVVGRARRRRRPLPAPSMIRMAEA